MASSGTRERVVRRRLADGTVKEYRYSREPKQVSRFAADTVAALLAAYRRSPEWAAFTAGTRRLKNHYLKDVERLAAIRVAEVRRKTLLNMRDAIATERGDGAANVFTRTIAAMFAWAVDREWLDHSPIQRVRQRPGGHRTAWTAAQADDAVARLPKPLARVVILARYTGQRRGDLAAMTWHAYDGERIRVHQHKTRVQLVIPCRPALKGALDEWRREATSTHILTSEIGRPWEPHHMSRMMRLALRTLGFPPNLNVHGLRKLCAAEMADAGCSTHEIAAVTGHKTLAMVQMYTASADQERLAQAAVIRLENASGKRKKLPASDLKNKT